MSPCAGQGSPGSLAFRLAPRQTTTTKAVTGQLAKWMGDACEPTGICIPGGSLRHFLGWKQCESNEFSSGEGKSFGSESRVDSRRVTFHDGVHPEVFVTTVVWNCERCCCEFSSAAAAAVGFERLLIARFRRIFERFSKA